MTTPIDLAPNADEQARARRSDQRTDLPAILCLLPGVPVPTDRGGRLRTHAVVTALDRVFDVTALCWYRDGDDLEAFRAALRGRVIALRAPAKYDAQMADALAALAGRPLGYQRYTFYPRLLRKVLEARPFDVVHFDHPHTALLFKLVKKLQPRARTVLDAHNVEADIVERLADAGPRWKRPLLRWQAARVRRLEKRLAGAIDLVLSCSEKDADEFRGFGAKRIRVVPNAIPPLLTSPAADRTDVIFVGSLDWRPNADAALTLAREVWPLVRDSLPGARLVLVGRNPPHAIRALACEDVVVTGGVESVAPYLRRARATAIPLRIGSGTRIKILEAWAAGIPVVASRIAAEGLPYTDGKDVLLAEDPMQFARALQRVWRDPNLAQRLMCEGRRTVEPFSPGRVAQRLVDCYCEELATASRTGGSDDRYRRPYSEAIA